MKTPREAGFSISSMIGIENEGNGKCHVPITASMLAGTVRIRVASQYGQAHWQTSAGQVIFIEERLLVDWV
jgi:hypothetical protein